MHVSYQLWTGIWSKQSLHTYRGGNYRYAWWRRWCSWQRTHWSVDNVQISNKVVDSVGFKDAKSALVTLKECLEQRPIDVTPFVQSIRTLQKGNRTWQVQESHQIIIDSFFHYA
jgi:hypothetical protein